MQNRVPIFLLRFWLVSTLVGCTAWSQRDLLPKEAYSPVSQALLTSQPQRALDFFPKGESGGFLTETEKAWLQVLSSDPRGALTRLTPMTEDLAARQTLSVSNSLSTFFYKELEDSYYPAEHEVIFAHLVAATAYAQLDQCQQVLVELRRAAFYLQGQFEHTRPQFDHGALRLWNAFLWHYCGEWESARIDLRVAAKLMQDPHLGQLAETATPPAFLELILEGIGPEAQQDDKKQTDVVFITAGHHSKAKQVAPGASLATASTLDLYPRLVERNRMLDEVMQSSRYYVDWTGYTLASGAMYGASVAGAGTLIVGGIGLIGAGVVGAIYVAAAANSAELGIIVGTVLAGGGAWMIGQGIEVGSAGTSRAAHLRKQGLDRSVGFRFLRYIPDSFTLHWDPQQKESSIEEALVVLDSLKPSPDAPTQPGANGKRPNARLSLSPSDRLTRMAAQTLAKGPLFHEPDVYLTEQSLSRGEAKEICHIMGIMLKTTFAQPRAEMVRSWLNTRDWGLVAKQENSVWTLDSPCSRFALDSRRLLKSDACEHLALVGCLLEQQKPRD